jgi:DNA-binding XRE family transcriptional regulator
LLEGYVIKSIRIGLGLSQRDFANEVGVKQQTISDLERGKLTLSDRLKQRIVYRFNIKPEEIEAIRTLHKIRNGDK